MIVHYATHILLAIDDSVEAVTTAHALRALLSPRSIHRLTILAVLQPTANLFALTPLDVPGAALIPQDAWEVLDQRATIDAHETLARVEAEVEDLALRVDALTRVGSPAGVIVEVATEIHATAIVLARHWSNERHAFLLGNVAERVVRHAPCSVFVVHPPPGHTIPLRLMKH